MQRAVPLLPPLSPLPSEVKNIQNGATKNNTVTVVPNVFVSLVDEPIKGMVRPSLCRTAEELFERERFAVVLLY